MKKTNAKFSISVHQSEDVAYQVSPAPDQVITQDLGQTLIWFYDTTKVLTVIIKVNKKHNSAGAVKLDNVCLNDQVIHNSDIYCTYVEEGSNQIIDHPYHYLSRPGVYKIKIRYAPAVHRYMTYLLSLCKQNKNNI